MRLAALCLLAACSDSAITVVMDVSDAPPAYGTVPFPTDALRDGDHVGSIAGLDALVTRHADIVAAHLAALDGFGLRPLVEFPVTGALAEDLEAPIALVDVDPASPERGRAIALDWHYDAERGVVSAVTASGELLREGTRYAAYITTDVRTADGSHLAPAAALASLGSHPRWQSTADALAELPANVAGVAVFTTQHATAPLVAARNVVETLPVSAITFDNPAVIFAGANALDRLLGTAERATSGPRAGLERWGNDNPTGMAHDHVGVVATGKLTVARFRGDDTNTNLPDDETFQFDASGMPRVIAMDTIPVTIILPSTPPPATGYPLVIYGHGLGAGRDQLLPFAEPLTSRGYAIAGIDMAGHGSRFEPQDLINNLSGKPAFTGIAAMPDGFGDTTGAATQLDFFEGFLGVAAVRDSIRQSALDLSQLSRALRSPALDLDPLRANAKLDTRHVAYLGESFGTVVGTLFAAIEPDIDLYVLDVPGGGIADLILPASAEIGALAHPIVESVFDPTLRIDRWNPLLHLMQAVIDGGDPLTYAPHILRDRFAIAGKELGARSVVCIEVMGDQVLPNVGTDALVQGLGLDVLAPNLAPPSGLVDIASPATANRDGQTAVLVQYSPATHGANWQSERGTLKYMPGFPQPTGDVFPRLPKPVTITNPIYETLSQVFEILDTHRAGSPVVRSTLAPIADFDGDGTPDATDPAPFDPAIP